jgi:hypothetical protein
MNTTTIKPSPLGEGVTAAKAVTDEVKDVWNVNLISHFLHCATKTTPSLSGEGENFVVYTEFHPNITPPRVSFRE